MATLAVAAVLAVCITWLVWRVVNFLRWKAVIDKIGGPPDLPLVGNAHLLKTDGAAFFQQMLQFAAKYSEKKAFRLWMGPNPMIFVYGADILESLLGNNKLITKSREYDFLRPWLGPGLLLSSGSKWKRRRKMLTPAFHYKILEDFVEVFNEQARVMVSKLDKLCDKGAFNVCPFINLCTLDIICETAMGCSVKAQESSGSEYVKAVTKISEIITQRWRTPWKQPDFLFRCFDDHVQHEKCMKILHSFTRKVITERMSKHEEYIKQNGRKTVDDLLEGKKGDVFGMKTRLAFMDMLLCSTEDGQPMSLEAIQEETDTFMFAGHDTTSSAISFAIHNIGAHPDVQRKLQQEMDGIFGESDRMVKTPDFTKMKYLECVIKESLRLFSTVPIFSREITEDAQLGSLFIPKDATVTCFTSALHRDPDVFPNPTLFDPDRFLPENSVKRSPYAFVPFSAGQRNCIGQNFAMREEKTVLTYILRNFHIESTQTDEEVKPVPDLVLRPQDGTMVKLTRRFQT